MRLLMIIMIAAIMLFAVPQCALAGIVNGDHQNNNGWISGGFGNPNHKPPGYSGLAGRPPSTRGARIGRTFGGVRGWTRGEWVQRFDCRPAGQAEPDKWCVVSFHAKYDPGEGERARVSLVNGVTGALSAKGIPATGAWGGPYEIWVKGCHFPMVVTFDIIDAGVAGIDSRLCIDDVDCSCQVDSPTTSGGLEDLSAGQIPTHEDLMDFGCEHNGLFDCNGNGEPDEDDIYNSSSDDVNGNGIPDECEAAGTGACILPDGTCADDVTQEACQQACGAYQGDGTSCAMIPTLTEWGLIIFGIVLLGFITWVFLRKRKAIGVSI